MKRIFCVIVTMLALTVNLVAQNTAIYREQGGDAMVVGSGGTLTVASGGSLVLASGSTLTDTATASHAGVQTFTGNVYFGAAGYKSTNTASSGAWAFPATLIVGGAVTASSTLDVTGNFTSGAAGYKSTNTASSGAWAFPAGVAILGALTGNTLAMTGAGDIAGQFTWGTAGTKSTGTVTGGLSIAGTLTTIAVNISGSGQLLMGNATSAALAALAPGQAKGALLINSTTGNLVMSTGTAVGAWVLVSTPTLAGY